jgi:superfamily II DNA/RNA helicase
VLAALARCTAAVGYEPQLRQLRRGVDVLVACPGRLADLVRQNAVDLSGVEVVVIDEADRMSDMGFLPEVRRLLDLTPDSRQTLLFSATLDGAVKVLTRDYQNNPVHHEIEVPDFDESNVHHVFWRVEGPNRAQVAAHYCPRPARRLCSAALGAALTVSRRSCRAKVFAPRRFTVVGRRISAIERWPHSSPAGSNALICHRRCRPRHSRRRRRVRRALRHAGRRKAYLHRSGRTARAGATGVVVSFVPHADRRAVARMQRVLDIPGALTAPGRERTRRSHRAACGPCCAR